MKNIRPITLEEIEGIWGNANFGTDLNERKMDVVKGSPFTLRGRWQLWEFFSQNSPSV